MADVHQGRDLRLQRPVALKLLRADLASSPALRASFTGEARSAARLRHPHVVSIFDTGEDGGVPYIVMELLPGATLADRIRAGRLEESTVRPLASQVLGALDAAHSAGILHRDVKPANILFDTEGGAKVADFGIAQAMEGGVAAELTSAGDVLGTPAYVAPERAEGRAASPASDLWSLGVVLYEALTQKRPFPGDTAIAAALAARQGSMTPLSNLRPDLSPRLVAVVERAVAPAPADRFASAAAMASALGVGLAGASPSRRLKEDGPALPPETRRMIPAGLLPPAQVAAGLSARLIAAHPGSGMSTPIGNKRPARPRKRGVRVARGAWLALAATAMIVLALVATGLSGVMGSASGPRAADSASSGHGAPGYSPPVTSLPTTSSTTPAPPSTSPATVPTTSTTTIPSAPPVPSTTAAAPSTTSPATTAVPPAQPASAASAPTVPALKGHGRHLGQLRHGGPKA
jgi:serine/threonine protein kinase